MSVVAIVGQVLIVAGAVVFATAALGLFRFFDTYTRVSAVGTAGGFGVSLVVVGALLVQPGLPDAIKVVAIVALQLATSAVATAAIARSAYLTKVPLRRMTFDELTPQDPARGDDRADPAL